MSDWRLLLGVTLNIQVAPWVGKVGTWSQRKSSGEEMQGWPLKSSWYALVLRAGGHGAKKKVNWQGMKCLSNPLKLFIYCKYFLFFKLFILHWSIPKKLGFPDSSVDEESTCNTGDPGLIPGSGRYPGEGIGYPLQYSWLPLWLSW